MSSPLNFAFGALGVAVICGMAFSGSVDGVLTKIASADAAAPSSGPFTHVENAGMTTIPAGPDGHFHVDLRVEGKPVRAVIDTGASMVAIPYEDAQRIGLYIPENAPKRQASTANGLVTFSVVKLRNVRINDIALDGVEGAVMPPGALKETLLGMSFIRRLGKFEMQRDRLVLAQ